MVLNTSVPVSMQAFMLTNSHHACPSSGPLAKTTSWKWLKCVRLVCCGLRLLRASVLKILNLWLFVHIAKHLVGLLQNKIHSTTWLVHVWKRWAPHWAIRNPYIRMRLMKPSRYLQTSLHVLRVIHNFTSKTKLRYVRLSTHGAVPTM